MKKWQKRLMVSLIVILLVIVGLVSFRHVKSMNDYERVLSDTLSFFQDHLTKLNDSVYQQDQIILSMENSIKLGLIDKEKLKAENWKLITHNIKLKETLYILKDSIKFIGEPIVIVVKDSSGKSGEYLKVPMSFGNITEFYDISGNVNSKGVHLDYVALFSYPEITIGWKKSGIMKKEPVVTYTNKNPYYILGSLDAITIEPSKPKWYESRLFWFVVGAGASYTISAVGN